MINTTGEGLAATPDAKARTAMERSNLYGFLAMIYRCEPSAALLAEMRRQPLHDALCEAGATIEKEFLDRPDEELLDELAVEYTRLFIGPGKHIPPYEGAQLDGALWSKSTSEVQSFIRGCGFDYDPDYHGLPDHISVELAFMQRLTAREAQAFDDADETAANHCREVQRSFVCNHLALWVPKFCAKVAAQAELPFYGEMSGLLKEFILSEAEELGETGLASPAPRASGSPKNSAKK